MSSSVRWNLGIDGGATKTLARLKARDGGTSIERSGGASSLTAAPEASIVTVLELAKGLAEEAGANPGEISLVGGFAGVSNRTAVGILVSQLQNAGFPDPQIVSDAHTSFAGASGGRPAVVVAIGTGSIAATQNRAGEFFTTGGWGFKVGDEASGAVLGRMAIQATMSELELDGKPVSGLARAICDVTGETKAETQSWVNDATPTILATLAPLVVQLHGEDDPVAVDIMNRALIDLEAMIRRADRGEKLPLTFVGGLAPLYKSLLRGTMRDRWFDAEGSSLDGACLLAGERS